MNENSVIFDVSDNSVHNINPSESNGKRLIDQVDTLTESAQPYVISLAILYVVIIFYLKSKLQTRAAYSLRNPLILWNFSMAAISLLFTYQFAIHLTMRIRDQGLMNGIYFQGNRSDYDIWMDFFAWSKIIELVDTLFIVFRKRPLTLLHWSHHFLTVIYVFFATRESHLLPSFLINSSIHTAMYSYYGLRALGVNVPRQLAMALTTAQILQMIFGIAVTSMAIYFQYRGSLNSSSYFINIYSILICSYYAVLFIKYFLNAYVKKVGKISKTD
ncbi:putative fatty acid elongase 4 [Brevipalpus obovatus]|uniref:putative fatty acid elongase 4 n=1 Tax=Brevipalpus obovatus TaxID=246614 RepID=UPI003D9E2087